jgi:hypothetical protein
LGPVQITCIAKAVLLQLNRTQFPTLGIFVSKKVGNRKNLDHFNHISFKSCILGSAATSGWAGWALAHLEFGRSVNPITTRGGRLCPTHYC